MPSLSAFRPRSARVEGALWMLLSCALLAGVAVFARVLTTGGLHPFQVVFLRVVFGFAAMLPLLAVRGADLVRTDQPRLYLVRVLSAGVSLLAFFSALSLAPVGEVTAISFLVPLFATLGAAAFLGEAIERRRWVALAAGFAGVLVILRPGVIPFGAGAMLAILAALSMGTTLVILKRMTAKDDPDRIVFLSSLLLIPLTAVPALFVWRGMDPREWGLLAVMGVVATLGHVTLTRALAATKASLVVGLDFARLPFAVLFGWLVLGELIDLWTWIGAGIIFLASVAVVRREAA